MTYRVQVAPAAARQLRKLAPDARRRVHAAIELLMEQPRPSGAKKLVGGNSEWRVRTGDHRIIYEIHDDVLVVLVVAAGLKSRSAAIQRAIRLLGDPELQSAYEAAWHEWEFSGEAAAWESPISDGLADAPR